MMKKALLSLLVAMTALLILSTSAFAADEIENNNDMYHATGIRVNDAVYGSIETGSDKDWYSITLEESGYFSVQFEHALITSPNTYWYITVYQADGNSGVAGTPRLWEVPGDQTSFTTAEVGVDAGTYYILVEPFSSGRYDTMTYTMKVNYTPSAVWEKETNNTVYDATPVEANIDYHGSIYYGSDKDWYVLTLKERGRLSVRFDHEQMASSRTYWYVTIQQSDGSYGTVGKPSLWEIPGDQPSFTTAEIGVDAGTYYILIEPFSSGRYDTMTYTMKVEYTPSSGG